MVASLADHLDVDRGENGTTVTVRRRLSRPARLLTADQIGQRPSQGTQDVSEVMLILGQPDAPRSRIAVHGPHQVLGLVGLPYTTSDPDLPSTASR